MCDEPKSIKRKKTQLCVSSGLKDPSVSRIKSQKMIEERNHRKKIGLTDTEKLVRSNPLFQPIKKQSSESEDSDATILMDDVEVPEPAKAEDDIPVLKCSIKMKTYGLRKPPVKPAKCKITGKGPHYYRCSACKVKFLKVARLNQHYKDNHLPVICDICKKEFSTPWTLECHLYIHKDLKFKCSQCGLRFPFASSWDSHQMSHTTDKTQVCKTCSKSYMNKGDLVHSKKIWRCQICAYENCDERNLKAHMRCHSNLKPYMCPSCLKLFRYHVQLAHHLPCKSTQKNNEVDNKLKRSGSLDY